MSETDVFVVLVNPGQAQACPKCGRTTEIASIWQHHVFLPESKIGLVDHQVTRKRDGYRVTATVICANCKNAFEIFANAARFRSPEMKCRICRRTKHMKPEVQDVKYDASTQLYNVLVTVKCRYCWMLTWFLSLFSSIFRLSVKEVELSLPGVRVKAGEDVKQ